MSITKKLAIAAFTIALSACGSDGGNNSPAGSSQGERLPIPEINPNRPKTGIGAILNVPWLFKDRGSDEEGLISRPYIYMTESNMISTTLCGIMEDGKRKWIEPTAKSPITWGDGTLDVLQEDYAEEVIGDWKCKASTLQAEFGYSVQENGEKLVLSVGNEDFEFILLRN